MRTLAFVAAVLLSLSGCATFSESMFGTAQPLSTSQTSGEMESGYTYVPIDPFPVDRHPGDSCKKGDPPWPLPEALPDNAVRMLVERFDLSGKVTYGTSKAGAKGESYRVTIDYINADTINVPVKIQKVVRLKGKTETQYLDLTATPGPEYEPGSEQYEVQRLDPASRREPNSYNIPVYVGLGLRISANVYVVGANANISGIGVIGAEAEAERLRGSLVVQTLGVNGKSVAAALPIQSELNRTTAQNAIVAVGSIKALLYAEETVKSPRVVGLYLPFPGGKALVNALISELSKRPVEWDYPCQLSQPVSKPKL